MGVFHISIVKCYVICKENVVRSQWQLTLFMSFLGFPSSKLGVWKMPKGIPMIRSMDPGDSNINLKVPSPTLYYWAMEDPQTKDHVACFMWSDLD